MLTKKESETNKAPTKRSYSYGDLIKMQSDSAYTSMGKVVPSQKPSAARATFGLSERSNSKKLASEKPIMQVVVGGKEGNGPASYFPSSREGNGKVKYTTDT